MTVSWARGYVALDPVAAVPEPVQRLRISEIQGPGEVMNTDVDPADVTVTAYMYDDKSELLTWYNAGAGMMHKLFPLEITPFRVDFEGVAGLALKDAVARLDFTPDDFWGYSLPEGTTLGHFDTFAKGVVTQHDLNRQVGVQSIAITSTAQGIQLSGILFNEGLQEAIIPHLLVTLYDDAGEAIWVDHFYLPQSIRPQRILPFSVKLTERSAISQIEIDGGTYTNSLVDTKGMQAVADT